MNNSKKFFFRFIIFAALFIPTYLAIYNIYIISSPDITAENTSKISAVRTADNYTRDYTESGDIKIFIKMLKDAKSITAANGRNLDSEKPIMLTFHKSGEELKYALYLTTDNKNCLLKDSDNKLMLLNSKDADALLNSPLSDAVYAQSQIPLANIPQGGNNSVIYPNGGNWYLKKPDGKFYASSVGNILAKTDYTNSARIFQNEPLNIQFSVPPDNVHIKVSDNKEVVFDDVYANFDSSYSSNTNKILQFVVTADWLQNDTNDYYGTAEYDINVSYEVPAVFSLSETDAKPGDIIIITGAKISDGSNYTVDVSDASAGNTDNTNNTDSPGNPGADIIYTTNFASADGKQIALVPIGLDSAGKTLNVTVSGGETPLNYQINVAALNGTKQPISASDTMVSNNLSPQALATKKNAYDSVLAVYDNFSAKYWDGNFVYPQGTEKQWLKYGDNVSINGGTYSYVNAASNLDTNPEAPIVAANTGKVIYSGKIPDDGNLVVIDHGMGVKTWYGHLASMNVKAGDDIGKGQQIGTAGNTGFYSSTIKYNLYFAVSVKGIFVNPIWLLGNGIAGSDIGDIPEVASAPDISTDLPSAAPESSSDAPPTVSAPTVSTPQAAATSAATTLPSLTEPGN